MDERCFRKFDDEQVVWGLAAGDVEVGFCKAGIRNILSPSFDRTTEHLKKDIAFEQQGGNTYFADQSQHMEGKVSPPQFESFQDFYEQLVQKLKEDHPGYLRLDGREKGGSRWPHAFFYYGNQRWKVDEDTRIEKLDKAYALLMEGQDPFLITSTIGEKGKCLLIKGEPIRPRYFYVYLTN